MKRTSKMYGIAAAVSLVIAMAVASLMLAGAFCAEEVFAEGDTQEVISKLDITLADPVCGTVVELDEGVPTIGPNVSVTSDTVSTVRALWGGEGAPFSGTIVGGQKYGTTVMVFLAFDQWENYSYDVDNMTVTLNGETVEPNTVTQVGVVIQTECVAVHDWDEPEGWTWADDLSTASAKVTCKSDPSHKGELPAKITSEKDGNGNRVYTATVKIGDETYTDEKTKPIEKTSAEVDFTSQRGGRFLHAPQFGYKVDSDLAEQFGYTDEPDGVSVLDVLVAAHWLVYGNTFAPETAERYLKIDDYGSPSRQFGLDSNRYYGWFFYNHAIANDGTKFDKYNWNMTTVSSQSVKDGDLVEFFFYEDSSWQDTYNWFTDSSEQYSREFKVCAGENFTLTLKGYQALGASIFKDAEEMTSSDMPVVIEGAQLYTVDLETGALTEIRDAVTDTYDGKVTLKFKVPGTYTIAAYGTDDCDCAQILSLTQIEVKELSDLRAEAIAEIHAYAEENMDKADPDKVEIAALKAENKIRDAKTGAEVAEVLTAGKNAIDGLVTAYEEAQSFETSKKTAMNNINSYVSEHIDKMLEEDKLPTQVFALSKILAVMEATEQKDIDDAFNAVKELVDAKVAVKEATDKAKALKVSSLKAKSKKRKFTVTWKKNAGADGYQVQYKLSSAKKFSDLKKATTKAKVVSKKLKKGKKYIFQVRTYKTVNGKKLYGKWVKTKAVKCK